MKGYRNREYTDSVEFVTSIKLGDIDRYAKSGAEFSGNPTSSVARRWLSRRHSSYISK